MRSDRAHRTMGRFTLVRQLGRGGSGLVYEALDPLTKRRLALKVLRTFDDSEPLVRFKREFRLMKMLAHRNIVALEELFSEENEWFFTMELVQGVDFISFARRGFAAQGPQGRDGADDVSYSEPRLRDTLVQLLSALEVMHEAGIAHRDVKPSNVLVTPEGRVVLLDFGVATDVHAHAARTGGFSVVGTPAYMAPEQALGEASGVAVDMYAVGVMLFEALTGRHPVEGTVMEVIARKMTGVDKSPRDLVASASKDLSQLAMDLLDASPDARPTAFEVLERLGIMSEAFTGQFTGDLASQAKRKRVFVGRQSELAALEATFDETHQGGVATVVVRGESGIGKTALLSHFLARLEDRALDVIILSGRCRESEWIPFKAFDGIMDDLARLLASRPHEAKIVLPRRADRLAQVFSSFRSFVTAPLRGAQGGAIDPIEQRSQLLTSVRELFERLCAEHHVILVIDDAQWADADSLAVLNELTRPPDAPPLTILVTMRSEGNNDPLKEPAFAHARVLDLARLSAEESVALVREMAPGIREPPASERAPLDAETIAREAQGHPMFIAELVRYSSLVKSDSRVLRLDDALDERLGALDRPSATVLRLIAQHGRPVTLTLVKQASSLDFHEVTRIATHLRSIHALRASTARGDHVEPYHNRVREVVLKAIPEAERRELHRLLATALELADDADAEALALHWRGAGEEERAIPYALKAAEAASDALAFDRAVELYEAVLASPRVNQIDGRLIAEKLGDALVNAGRGVRAAAAYRRAARGAPVAMALNLERRAADELVRAGHFDEGLEAVRAVLAAIGMSLPETPLSALVRFIVGRLLLRARGLGFKRRDATEMAATELTRVDVCRSASFGLGVIDTVRGAAFQVHSLLLALRAGEITRISFALSSESVYVARPGGASFRRAMLIADRAAALAEEANDPNAIAYARGTRGVAHYLNGHFRQASELCHSAQEMFRSHCTGVTWELTTNLFFKLNALAQLGEVRRLAEELPRALREATEQGNRYGTVCLRSGLTNLHWLALDQPLEAERQIQDAMREWSQQGFHLEHFYELLSLTNIDLYVGRSREALARLAERWGALQRSLLPFTIQSVRILVRSARARSAMAAAQDGGGAAALRAAERDAGALAREHAAWAAPQSKVVFAAIAHQRGSPERAVALLRDAVDGFDAVDMSLHAAAARRRLGALVSGEEGAAHVRAADERMAAEGVKNPDRIVATFAPGFAARGG